MDAITPEALSKSLQDILDFKIYFEAPITFRSRKNDNVTETRIYLDSLFDSMEQYAAAGELLLQLIIHDSRFETWGEFITHWSNDDLSKDTLKNAIVSFEESIKDIIGILNCNARKKLDDTGGLGEVINIAKNQYNLIGENSVKIFDFLRAHFRNDVIHGNLTTEDLWKQKDQVAALFFACLSHIVSRASGQLNSYLADKTEHVEKTLINEGEIIKKYVNICGEAFASYLENNIPHDKNAEDLTMPVLIRETSGAENTDYDALKFLLNAPDGKYIILGVPGAGKSTLLNNYLLEICRAFISDNSDIVPLLIKASDVEKDMSFIDTVRACATARRMNISTVEKLLDDGRLAIAIDGINEFPPEVNANKFLKDVMQNAKGRLVMTGRIYEYTSVKNTIDEYGKHRIFRIQDISRETIIKFLEKNFDEAMSHRMVELFKNDSIFSLLNCPLNLKFLINSLQGKEDVNDFKFNNRGGLISDFLGGILRHEGLDKDTRAGWLLENLALHTVAKNTISIYDFADEAINIAPNVYDKREIVREKLIEPLVRAGILQKTDDAEIHFRLDTFREYFLARIYAASFTATLNRKKLNGRETTGLPAVDDDNNNETFRLMLELMDADSARNLAEKLYADRCGNRKPVELKPEMFIGKANNALAWICDLVRTLDSHVKNVKDLPDAKTICGNWVINNMKILLGQKKDAPPEIYKVITQAAASLCTERVIRFLTGDRWLNHIIGHGLANDTASIIAAYASNARLVYRILADTLPNYRRKDDDVGHTLRDIHRKLLFGMNTLQLDLLHRDIGHRIKEIESKNQSVPTEIYADYYLTALLTNDMELINAIPPEYIRKAEPSMRHDDYDRLLDCCATVDKGSALFNFFAKRTDKYRTDINLLVYVIRYLVQHKNENFAAELLKCDSFVNVAEERYYSETILRNICALLPLRLIPSHIANKLYESSLLEIVSQNANENNFARNIKRTTDEAYATIANDNLYFDTAAAKARPNLLKCNAKFLSKDDKNSLSIVCNTLAATKKYIGAKAILGIGTASTIEGTVEKCEMFDGNYFEMIFGFEGNPTTGLCGKLEWTNTELGENGWLEYSMCVYESNTVMLRFISQGALNQLNKKEVREALVSPLTVFRIGDKLHIPLRSIHYPKIQNGTRITIRFDKPLSFNNKKYLNITTIMLKDANGDHLPIFQQNYVEGSNKSAHPLLLFREEGTDEAVMLFDEKTVRHVCPGLWISAQGSNYHALVKDHTENFGKILDCADFELSCQEIPSCGTFTINRTETEIKYFVRENYGNGKFRALLLADEKQAEDFCKISSKYPKLTFSDGSDCILQHTPEITDLGSGMLIKISLRRAPADITKKWSDTPEVNFNILRSVINECKVKNTIYKTTAVPYFRHIDSKIEIPMPINAEYVNGLEVYVNDRNRTSTPCTIHPRSRINSFARKMEIGLKNSEGLTPAIDKDRGLLFLKKDSRLEYRNVLDMVQFESGKLYHPEMVRHIIEAMIQNDDTELDRIRMKFFHDSQSEHLLMLYDITREQFLNKYKADEYQKL